MDWYGYASSADQAVSRSFSGTEYNFREREEEEEKEKGTAEEEWNEKAKEAALLPTVMRTDYNTTLVIRGTFRPEVVGGISRGSDHVSNFFTYLLR